ncbi:hypothetical protein [Lysinibacillus cavernae]|nr:hypothetical protein [Lysinibacillus cavernae]
MNKVVGMDISNGENQVQPFLDIVKPYNKNFKTDQTWWAVRHPFISPIKK